MFKILPGEVDSIQPMHLEEKILHELLFLFDSDQARQHFAGNRNVTVGCNSKECLEKTSFAGCRVEHHGAIYPLFKKTILGNDPPRPL